MYGSSFRSFVQYSPAGADREQQQSTSANRLIPARALGINTDRVLVLVFAGAIRRVVLLDRFGCHASSVEIRASEQRIFRTERRLSWRLLDYVIIRLRKGAIDRHAIVDSRSLG